MINIFVQSQFKNKDLCKRFFDFEQVFVCRIYFNSVYIIPVGKMLFNNFLTDVNEDLFNILQYIFEEVRSLYRNEDFNFLIKIRRISWLAPYFCVHIYRFQKVGNHQLLWFIAFHYTYKYPYIYIYLYLSISIYIYLSIYVYI